MFEIIKNAPPPPVKASSEIYPFVSMEVGDAFDAPRDMGKTRTGGDRRQNSINAATQTYRKAHNSAAKFTVRILDADTVRCRRFA